MFHTCDCKRVSQCRVSGDECVCFFLFSMARQSETDAQGTQVIREKRKAVNRKAAKMIAKTRFKMMSEERVRKTGVNE